MLRIYTCIIIQHTLKYQHFCAKAERGNLQLKPVFLTCICFFIFYCTILKAIKCFILPLFAYVRVCIFILFSLELYMHSTKFFK